MIRNESPDDFRTIRKVVEAAFTQVDEADLVDSLRKSGDAVLSLVAEDGGFIVGHILFSQLKSPQGCLALAPISVLPENQSQGIGEKLMREGLARAKHNGWQAVFVLGEPAYYTRFGFSAAPAEKFETDFPKVYFMALELTPGALEELSGAVVYPQPFMDLE